MKSPDLQRDSSIRDYLDSLIAHISRMLIDIHIYEAYDGGGAPLLLGFSIQQAVYWMEAHVDDQRNF
jgi:hypothetical protein